MQANQLLGIVTEYVGTFDGGDLLEWHVWKVGATACSFYGRLYVMRIG
jgi:hypothetical protein